MLMTQEDVGVRILNIRGVEVRVDDDFDGEYLATAFELWGDRAILNFPEDYGLGDANCQQGIDPPKAQA